MYICSCFFCQMQTVKGGSGREEEELEICLIPSYLGTSPSEISIKPKEINGKSSTEIYRASGQKLHPQYRYSQMHSAAEQGTPAFSSLSGRSRDEKTDLNGIKNPKTAFDTN